MSLVAGSASFHFLGKVFIDPRSALFGMALETGFLFGIEVGLAQARPLPRSVRAMAVGTLHCTLKHLVGIRQIKFRFHILMAGEAEIYFLCFQEILSEGLPVNSVAVVASYGAQLMNRSPELEEILHFFVTAQAGVGAVLRLHAFKGTDHSFPFCFRMLGARTMAGFAFLLGVGVLLKGVIDIGVTSFTGLSPDKPFAALPSLAEGSGSNEGYCHR